MGRSHGQAVLTPNLDEYKMRHLPIWVAASNGGDPRTFGRVEGVVSPLHHFSKDTRISRMHVQLCARRSIHPDQYVPIQRKASRWAWAPALESQRLGAQLGTNSRLKPGRQVALLATALPQLINASLKYGLLGHRKAGKNREYSGCISGRKDRFLICLVHVGDMAGER
ncbi:hypothetical protein PAXRUDRAFT_252346 [Paxillus rubicundulus Ve08.2h10]|uniref:Uncharacterized protein n=1 Tax=Paxillus rubicundulus Ve08.2h10 TaxID=930991 RepID=A0A0D0ED22_9AGAM|nr:hypothetical protein PAXRUDRAFT_252346 [Paxillus rubicundulus Ve08.2h10]